MSIILFQDVDIYPDGQEPGVEQPAIVKEVGFTINSGEWVNLVGRNGSGKSTLARAIAGYARVELEGTVERNMGAMFNGDRLPLVLQFPDEALVGSTPWEDVTLTLEHRGMNGEEIIEAVRHSLTRFGLGSVMNHSFDELSGGQKQLTAAASCLATGAPLLLFDEATSMLDPESADLVQQALRRLHREGTSILWVTQKLEELRRGDRVLVMEEGMLVFDGLAQHFFARQQAATNDHNRNGDSRQSRLSQCEVVGLKAPYVVETAWALERRGICFAELPLTPEDLVQEVSAYGI